MNFTRTSVYRPVRRLAALNILLVSTLVVGPVFAGTITFGGQTVTTNGTATADGTSLQLINNQFGAQGSGFVTAPYILTPATSFISSFSFMISNNGTWPVNEFSPYAGNTASFSFDIQNTGDSTYNGGGDGPQIAAVFASDQSYVQNSGLLQIPYGTAQIQQNGGGGPYSAAMPFNLQNNFSLQGPGPYDVVTGSATVSYDSTTSLFTLVASDSVGGNVNLSMLFNLFGDLDTSGNVVQPPPYGYIGFLASTGGQLSQVEISNFSVQMFSGGIPTSATPEPAAGGVLGLGLGAIFLLRKRFGVR